MYSILYVDDEEGLLELGKIFLEQDGTMSVETVTSAEAALDRIASARFDAVISDYQMPGMDGIMFLKTVRSRFGNLPFILFTGRGREEVVIQAINNGADLYLQKGGHPASQFAELSHKVKLAVDRQRTEQALQRETSFTQAIFDSIPGILYLYDSEGRLIRWNKNHENLTGYTAEELTGRQVLDWFPDPAEKKIILDGVTLAMRDGQASAEAHLATKSGSLIPFVFTARRLEFGGKTYFTGVGVDISERRKAEEALHASEEKFRGISERSSDLIYVEDENGVITYVSPSITQILGYDPEEAIGRDGGLFVMEEDLQKIQNGRKVKQTGGSFENFEIRVRRKDGSSAVLELQAIPIVNEGVYLGLQVIARDMTGRRKAEKALEESEERYRALIEHSHDGAFLEQDGFIVYCNRQLAMMLGYTPDEIRAMPISGMVSPEERGQVMDQYLRWVTGDHSVDTFEFTMVRADGQRVDANLSVGAGMYHNRLASIGTVRDISRERAQIRALRESEELYHTLADSLPDFVLVHRGGTVLFANRNSAEITGIPQENLVGRSIFDFIAPESRDLVIRKMKQREAGISTGRYEVAVRVRDGGIRTALVNSTEIPYKGSPAVLIVMSDVTSTKELVATLRESEERFRVLTEHSLDTIMLFDRQLRHLYVNPAVVRGLGIPPAEFIGKTHHQMGFPDHLVNLWEGALTDVFESGKPAEIEFQLPNGIWADWLLAPIHAPDGSVDQVLASARVITKMKLVEETLRRANRQVNLLNAITRHDILNQITVILAFLTLAEQKSADPSLADYYRKLRTAAETIRDQIEFTRIYEDIGSDEPQWQHVESVLRRQQVPSGITLTTDLPPVEVFADPMLEKVFSNLLDNAARHGGPDITVRVLGREGPDGFLVLFEDNGRGIAESEKERIFERGFGKNTGLGLFLVRDILSITGITIRETGTDGKGARFELAVPKGAYRFRNGTS